MAKDLKVTDSRGRQNLDRKALRLDYQPGTFLSDFGCLGVIGNASSEAFLANVPKNWATWDPTDPLVQKGAMDSDGAAGTVLVPKDGVHYIFFSASVDVPAAAEIFARIAINGDGNATLVMRDRDGGASNPSTLSSAAFVFLQKGSLISLQLEVPANLDLTLTDGSFGVWRMAD